MKPTNQVTLMFHANQTVLVTDRASGLRGLYDAKGYYLHGDLRLSGFAVVDNAFNRAWPGCRELIGNVYNSPPSYTAVFKLSEAEVSCPLCGSDDLDCKDGCPAVPDREHMKTI